MEIFFIYFIKVSVLVSLFYLSYSLLLKKETFFSKNRWFLLAGLIASVLLPLFTITKTVWIEPQAVEVFQEPIYFTDFPEEMMLAEHFTIAEPEPQKTQVHWSHLVAGFYLLGALFFLSKLMLSSLSLYKILHKSPFQKQNGLKILDGKTIKTPFSFFNYIALDSSAFSEEELQNIIAHEKVHCKQKHSFDVLFSEIFSIVFWLNPFVWFYKKAIQQNLEFIADHKAVKTSENKVNYQKTLLKITLQPQELALANPFFQPLIKKRIIMLNKNQSKQKNVWKYTVVLPLLVLFMIQFQTQVVAQEKENTTQEIQKNPVLEISNSKNPTGVETIVTFLVEEGSNYTNEDFENDIKKGAGSKIYIAGATEESASLVIINGKEQENTFYPKDLEIGIQGVGSYKKYAPKEAVEKFGEKAKNGAYVIEAEKFIIKPVYEENKETQLGKNPLIVVNGKEIGNKDFVLNNKDVLLNNMDILSFETKGTVTHYDKESAVKKFGEKAKDGAIVFEGKDIKISFQSNEKEPHNKKTNLQKQNDLLKTLKVYGKGEKPLYIVNGKEISEEELNKMRLGKVDIDVLDYKEAVKKFGEKARHGAIVIQEKSIIENGKELFDFLKTTKDYKQIDIYTRWGNLIYTLKPNEKLDEEKLKSLDDGTYFYTLDKSSGERTVGYIYKGDDTTSKRLQVIKAKEREEAEIRAKQAEERKKEIEIRKEKAEKRAQEIEIRTGSYKVHSPKDIKKDLLNDEKIDYKKAYISINGKEASPKDLENLKSSNIRSVSSMSGAEAFVKSYGEKAKYGIIEIETQDYNSEEHKKMLKEIKAKRKAKDYPLLNNDNDGFIIHKASTEQEFEFYKSNLKKIGIEMKVSNIKRNKNGEIYKIKISLVEDSETGNNKRKAKSEAVFERENETIPDIFIGRRDGYLIVSSDKKFQ